MTEPTVPYPCPACGSTDTTPVLDAKDYTVTGALFTIHQCQTCTLRFTFPVPDQNQIGRYYKSEDYVSHSDTQRGLINKLYHGIRSISLSRKKSWVESATGIKTGNILDIGCGTGYFLHEMKQSGWLVTGLEPDEKARELAHKKRQITALPTEKLFQLPPHSFHAITLWHVLEHVHDLHAYLDRIRELLHPEGRLFIAVPNYTAIDQEKYGACWAAYDVPRHLYHFSPQSLRLLTERHGLFLQKQQAMPFDAFYICLLSEQYAHGKTNYLKGFLSGFRSWKNARKSPASASSVLYILRS